MRRQIEHRTPPEPTKPGPTHALRCANEALNALSPAEIPARWPADRELACLVSAGPGRFSRWSIFAQPRKTITLTEDAVLWSMLDRATAIATPMAESEPDEPPFRGGLIGWIGYAIGASIEPRAGLRGPDRLLGVWAECPDAIVHDALHGRWLTVGDPERLRPIIDEIVRNAGAGRGAETGTKTGTSGFELGPLSSAIGREGYMRSVAAGVEYIRAGDVFQVNLAHPLRASFDGCARTLASALLERSGAWFGGLIETEVHDQDEDQDGDKRVSVLSLSPELFLRYDPKTRLILTSPMKGTRPASADAEELRLSPKDRAELNMITDLMRNDLGRVASFGSVRVADPRRIERHAGPGGVIQASSEVAATLRPGLGLADLLRAALPAGSITGAPKVRAMQIIDELEPFPRGAYCGVIGFISDSGHAEFSVAIRTATLRGRPGPGRGTLERATLEYPVGAGIVADSDPQAEWAETLAKAGVLRSLTEITDRP